MLKITCLLAVFVFAGVAVAQTEGPARRRAVRQPGAPLPPTPVANDDSFNLTTTNPTPFPAPGILGNDTLNGASIVSYGPDTGEETPFSAGSSTTTKGGSVQVNADGSFSYAPPAGIVGNDSFKYVLRNSAGSATGTVRLILPVPVVTEISVRSPGFFFTFSTVAGQNPVLTLQRGKTYHFEVDTDEIHPFQITGAPDGSVTNNNISAGILTFTVPDTAQNYSYRCSIHGFGNSIITTSP
jgi:hypothetical protein